MRRPARHRRRERAQALVEFALVLGLFLLLLVALIDFARLLFTYISFADGAREMARVAAISGSPDASAIGAFNNYTLIAGGTSGGDQVVITVADQACAINELGGTVPCTSGTKVSTTCPLPLQTSCALPPRSGSIVATDGYVDVAVTYTFAFAPLFQAPFGVAFLRPSTVLTTTARAYLE